MDVEVLRRFAVATGQSPDVEQSLPLLAHWAFFLEAAEDARIGEDGHPLRGDFLPAVSLQRRMFGAIRTEFEHSLDPGVAAECVTTIRDVRQRSGQTGDLVFVELHREIKQSGRVCVQENQTAIYRNAGTATLPSNTLAQDSALGSYWLPQPVELFRFSAVTFNAHRIHYDLPYAQGVEGYPALVVQGPLTAVKLLRFAVDTAGRRVRSFDFKQSAPLFVGQPVRLLAGKEKESFIAVRCDGVTSATASVTFE